MIYVMSTIQLDLFSGGVIAPTPDGSQVKASAFDESEYEVFNINPCRSCPLLEWCSDECAQLGFKVNVPHAPKGLHPEWNEAREKAMRRRFSSIRSSMSQLVKW